MPRSRAVWVSFYFFRFYQKKRFKNYEKLIFIFSNKLFLFLRYSVFFFLSFPVSRFKGPDQKINFFKHVCNSKRQVSSSRTCLFFIILSIKRGWVQKKKSSYLFMVSFKITYFQKSLTCIACFGHQFLLQTFSILFP